MVFNHADCRLMSARAGGVCQVQGGQPLPARHGALVGFKSTCVPTSATSVHTRSHYPLSKMLSLAFDGITSLSIKPIRFITAFGVIVALISFIGVIWAMVRRVLA